MSSFPLPLTEPDELKIRREGRPPLVKVVSHCYAAELPQYAAMLVYQVSSLVLHKPKSCRVTLSICVWGEKNTSDVPLFGNRYRVADPNVAKILPWVKKILMENDIFWEICYLKKDEIGRRCIGRNCLASSYADFIWFADVDHMFRDGILDRLVEIPWPSGASMIYPREIMIHRDWITGDKRTSAVDLNNPQLVDIDPPEFVPKRYRQAIGGVQIVRGDFARKHGYLNDDKQWQRPSEKPFGNFRDDVAYRRFCVEHGPIVGVDLPGVFRLRHTRTTYQEDKK